MTNRLNTFRNILKENNIEAAMITNHQNIEWLSGFTGSSGRLFITRSEALIATDSRYFEQARQQATEFTLFPIERKTLIWLPELLRSLNIKELAFEQDTPFYVYEELQNALSSLPKLKLVSLGDALFLARSIKDASEIEKIRRAIEVTDKGFNMMSSMLRPGMSEKEIAWQTEKFMRDITKGEELAFTTIVASGPNSALPHHTPSDRKIQEGEPILFDMGAKYNGYCADLSRTVFLGNTPPFFVKIYDTVQRAQNNVIKNARIGMSGGQLDELARSIIREAGYGENFGHSTGHGFGLYIHERPNLSPEGTDIIKENMVFTVEPGIYVPEKGGVRIEDTVLMKEDGAEVLSKAIKVI